MPKTPEEKREYNRVLKRRERERKKALGISINNTEIQKKAKENFFIDRQQLQLNISNASYKKFKNLSKTLNLSMSKHFENIIEKL